MDSTNNPTPTPTPTPTPASGVNPVLNNTASETPSVDLANPVSTPEPTVATPPVSANPTTTPTAPVNPVNPVINPTGQGVSNPVFQPTSGVSATDPIMMPEAPTPPDPIEEELKAPMKAADPVPGSIGSAISGPTGGNGGEMPVGNIFTNEPDNTPNVSFNDPAMQQDNVMPVSTGTSTAQKSNKTTLIILIAVASVIVIALAVILIMQLMGGK